MLYPLLTEHPRKCNIITATGEGISSPLFHVKDGSRKKKTWRNYLTVIHTLTKSIPSLSPGKEMFWSSETLLGLVRSVPRIPWTWGQTAKIQQKRRWSVFAQILEWVADTASMQLRQTPRRQENQLGQFSPPPEKLARRKKKKNKLLPSSPRRLTSSWDRVLCCFNASSRCGKHTSSYSCFQEGPFQ